MNFKGVLDRNKMPQSTKNGYHHYTRMTEMHYRVAATALSQKLSNIYSSINLYHEEY